MTELSYYAKVLIINLKRQSHVFKPACDCRFYHVCFKSGKQHYTIIFYMNLSDLSYY